MDTILPHEIRKRLDQGEVLNIIDVREAEEVAASMIPGAKHIPLGDLPIRHSEIPVQDEIILVCRSGGRSSMAYDFLTTQGYKGLKNMTGGMLEWDKQ
jgi:rhodanese-related sulfurtransferase